MTDFKLLEERFWAKINKTNTCWIWQGHSRMMSKKLIGLSGIFTKDKLKTRIVHRIAWQLIRGSISSNDLVIHTCNNTLCCNPDHLTLTTKSGLWGPPEKRFWDNVNKNKDCWEWQGSKCERGYGFLSINGEHKSTHRIAWEWENGPIPEGMYVCHHCDNPSCVRATHLFLGEPKDNSQDMVSKNRQPKGEDHLNSKLTNTEVIEIRRLNKEEKYTTAMLARKYDMDNSTIHSILLGKGWKHLL